MALEILGRDSEGVATSVRKHVCIYERDADGRIWRREGDRVSPAVIGLMPYDVYDALMPRKKGYDS